MKAKNPSPNPDLHFIEGKYNQIFNGETFTIKNGDKEKVFSKKEYLRLVLDQCYEAVDNSESSTDKIQALFHGEAIIKRIIDSCGLNFEDFDGIFKDIDVIHKRLNNYKETDDKKSAVRTTASIAIIAAVLGGSTPELIKLFQKSPQSTYIVVPNNEPRDYLQNDTVFLKAIKDTSLVRIVKLKHR